MRYSLSLAIVMSRRKVKITTPQQLPTKNVEEIYEYLEKLGEGSYGEVWKVRDRRTKEILALKVIFMKKLAPHLVFDSIREDAFILYDTIQELEVLKDLSSRKNGCHPGVVCYHDLFNCGDRLCITMEFIKGRTVETLLNGLEQSRTRLEPTPLYNVMKQTLAALTYIHSKGVSHRDIKGENMIIRDDGEIVFVDFGLSCFFDAKTRTRTRYKCRGWAGTRDFMAPEVVDRDIEDHPDWWPNADVWSLGIVFMELAMGAGLDVSIGEEIAEGRMSEAPKLAYKDPILASIINEMLQTRPESRPSARALLTRLNAHTPRPELELPDEARPSAAVCNIV